MQTTLPPHSRMPNDAESTRRAQERKAAALAPKPAKPPEPDEPPKQ